MQEMVISIVALGVVIVGLAQLLRNILTDSNEQRDEDWEKLSALSQANYDLRLEITNLKLRIKQLEALVLKRNRQIRELVKTIKNNQNWR